MDYDTTNVSAFSLVAYYVVMAGSIIAVGISGLINLYNDNLGRGLGLIIMFFILLGLFVWLEKSTLKNSH